ncbi:aminodeoxychorismate synthase pabA [Aspergillus homomorphus CBS 101889]|uniref:aminodeoxychorismate synthase n=1 Tax=Aspergillus homomorphus (strain CBS 101889) TaxID=1450537 RepID=A0A395HK10_ASPHC|nr:synthase ABZ1 [Aspergillus homomorphus CBS 101889]RAL07763.1 synthase ABZ1 [Aspergillus homomorphus CBS 101889]
MAPSLGFWESADPRQPTTAREFADGLSPKNILYIDAYDSFSYNVVAMLEEVLGAKVTVLRIDSPWPNGDMADYVQHFEAIVLGPGPGDPHISQDVGIMRDVWNLNDRDLLPIFGICLGFQSLCLHQGASIRRLPYPIHGQVRRVQTTQEDIFRGVQGLEVTLYHSLYAEMQPMTAEISSHMPTNGFVAQDLDLLAWLSVEQENIAHQPLIPMAVRHNKKPFWAVQFHPESCKSDRRACSHLLKKWWDMALHYNKLNGRGSYRSVSTASPRSSSDPSPIPDIIHTMLEWSASTSSRSSFRDFTSQTLEAETICEAFNSPGSSTVLFKSNGRYSVISVPSPGTWRLEYSAQEERVLLIRLPAGSIRDPLGDKQTVIRSCLPVFQFWNTLRLLMETKKVVHGNDTVPFCAGLLGYFSYEMGLASIARPESHAQDFQGNHTSRAGASLTDPADASFLWTERSVVLDHLTGRITIQSTRETDDLPNGWLDDALLSLRRLATTDTSGEIEHVAADTQSLNNILERGVVQFPDRQVYENQFDACREQLLAGESYELCLTCETTITLPIADSDSGRKEFPWKLYRRLQKHNPAAFSAYAKLGELKIVSSSPECFLNWDRHSMLEMKPMKGTVRKTKDMTLEKARDILGSTKEMAENLMIADLIRHDLYGICGSGAVHVEKLLEVEDHGRVYQMITHVIGRVDPNRPGFAVQDMPQLHSSGMSAYGLTALQRCLPPGSMTGAPKERSCLHLSSIENRKRGIYSGAMGFLDLGGGGSFSVLIRTAFNCAEDDDPNQVWRIGAGGAVTILSTAEGEWEEMSTKLRTVLGAFVPLDDGPVKAA